MKDIKKSRAAHVLVQKWADEDETLKKALDQEAYLKVEAAKIVRTVENEAVILGSDNLKRLEQLEEAYNCKLKSIEEEYKNRLKKARIANAPDEVLYSITEEYLNLKDNLWATKDSEGAALYKEFLLKQKNVSSEADTRIKAFKQNHEKILAGQVIQNRENLK